MKVFVRVICFEKALTNYAVLPTGISDQNMLAWVSLEGSYKCDFTFTLDDLLGLPLLLFMPY